jgi:hypothetical protein
MAHKKKTKAEIALEEAQQQVLALQVEMATKEAISTEKDKKISELSFLRARLLIILRGSRNTPCDWEVDPSGGWHQ